MKNTLHMTLIRIILLFSLSTVIYAAHTSHPKALTMSELKILIAKLPTNDIPVEPKAEVLREVNYIITNPGIAKSYKIGIKRLSEWKDLNDILESQHVPTDLMAIVLVESRGENFPGKNFKRASTAGLWQIIPSTARKYGLTVNAKQDDRFNPIKSTQAMAHYLKDLYQQTGSWPLAIMGYNMGGIKVANLQKRNHSNDPWILLHSSHLPQINQRYLPIIEAAVILMHYPELLSQQSATVV